MTDAKDLLPRDYSKCEKCGERMIRSPTLEMWCFQCWKNGSTEQLKDVQRPAVPTDVQYETCPSCGGSGLTLSFHGEPDECHECKGDTVIPMQSAPSIPPKTNTDDVQEAIKGYLGQIVEYTERGVKGKEDYPDIRDGVRLLVDCIKKELCALQSSPQFNTETHEEVL